MSERELLLARMPDSHMAIRWWPARGMRGSLEPQRNPIGCDGRQVRVDRSVSAAPHSANAAGSRRLSRPIPGNSKGTLKPTGSRRFVFDRRAGEFHRGQSVGPDCITIVTSKSSRTAPISFTSRSNTRSRPPTKSAGRSSIRSPSPSSRQAQSDRPANPLICTRRPEGERHQRTRPTGFAAHRLHADPEQPDIAASRSTGRGQIATNIESVFEEQLLLHAGPNRHAHMIEEGPDPLVAFLYDFKKGHCEYFAGALWTLLCQSLGLEARMVVGFHCEGDAFVGGYYQVQQSHAHAWGGSADHRRLENGTIPPADLSRAQKADANSRGPQFPELSSILLECANGDRLRRRQPEQPREFARRPGRRPGFYKIFATADVAGERGGFKQ